jgi:hypothetical protein
MFPPRVLDDIYQFQNIREIQVLDNLLTYLGTSGLSVHNTVENFPPFGRETKT